MATLTGFKQVAEQPTNQSQQGGRANPVFVFDEIDVNGDSSDQTTNEEFVDASSQIPNQDQSTTTTTTTTTAQEQKQNNIKNSSSSAQKKIKQQQEDGTTPQAVSIEISQDEREEPTSGNKMAEPAAENGLEEGVGSSTPPMPVQPAAVQPQRRQQSHRQNKQATSATGAQLSKGASNKTSDEGAGQQQQRQPETKTANSLAPNKDDGDNISLLAIDCLGTGKSPRQPRRSPLMALFRGKPRESVRRTYTDEDQFEIEWANLSLEVQKKWYHKFSLTRMLLDDGRSGSGSGNDDKPRMILRGVDGRIKSGEITAVLGPSGAGKTSLLNGLFGKYRTAVQGAIKVTGAPSKKHLTVCTIPQSDFLIGHLTTEESLWFASRLKNCEDDFNHDRNIERVIELLGLQRCRHTRINKLSGGQYKRVSIAQEMLSSPDILVLDEPTSGLDSLTCYRTVKVLRDLVEASKAHNLVNPMSIILTIHQPHREVLDLFHSVYVMAVGGQTMFQGPPGEMEDFINKHSGTNMPAQGYNPASFMVELASEEYGRKPIEALVERQREKFKASTKRKYNYTNLWEQNHSSGEKDLVDLYSSKKLNSNHHTSDSQITLYPLQSKQQSDGNNRFVDIDLSAKDRSDDNNGLKLPEKDIDSRIMTPRSGKNSDGVFWRHVNLMSKRCFLSNTRDPLLCTIRVGAHIFIPLVVAIIYGPRMGIPNGCPFYKPEINLLEYASMGVEEIQEKHDDIRIQFQNVGLHFMVYYAFGLCMLAFTAISFPLIMHVLIKEIRNGWYSLATFIIGKMFAELPMAILLPPISVGIIYIMTGQPSSYLQWRYLVQSLILILIVMIAEAKGLIFGAICMNSMQTAVFAASVSTVPFILLSGFLIRIREVPYVLQHLAQFSYFKHSVEALIITRYGFGMCPCDPDLIPVGGTPRIIGIPPQIMSLTDYYINSYVSATENSTSVEASSEDTNVLGNNRRVETIVNSITTLSPDITNLEGAPAPNEEVETGDSDNTRRRRRRRKRQATASAPRASGQRTRTPGGGGSSTTSTAAPKTTTTTEVETATEGAKQGLFFDKLATLLTRANAFGFSITSCEDVEPFTMKDMFLKDSMLAPVIGYLFLSILVMKFVSYFIVEVCVKLKL